MTKIALTDFCPDIGALVTVPDFLAQWNGLTLGYYIYQTVLGIFELDQKFTTA
jgi:hypothetical protein